jgi:hypothetical protein
MDSKEIFYPIQNLGKKQLFLLSHSFPPLADNLDDPSLRFLRLVSSLLTYSCFSSTIFHETQPYIQRKDFL